MWFWDTCVVIGWFYPPKIANISQIRVEIQGPQMQLVFGTPHWKGQYSVAWDIGISSGNDCTYKTQFLSKHCCFPWTPKSWPASEMKWHRCCSFVVHCFLNSNLLTCPSLVRKSTHCTSNPCFQTALIAKRAEKRVPTPWKSASYMKIGHSWEQTCLGLPFQVSTNMSTLYRRFPGECIETFFTHWPKNSWHVSVPVLGSKSSGLAELFGGKVVSPRRLLT